MSKYSAEDLNQLAMEIILHAGDARTLISDAFAAAEKGEDIETVQGLLNDARKEITTAHKIQTDVIQSTDLDDNQKMTLLFIHAQDTLMTINSELFMSENVLHLHYKKKEAK
ncbi:PTS lactose/cellobiose transporter subunit IIA [bacterium 1XD21-13]|nr:PTS lactose/cellobiose transporter subunit IIA [bacterium 1XD21-13]